MREEIIISKFKEIDARFVGINKIFDDTRKSLEAFHKAVSTAMTGSEIRGCATQNILQQKPSTDIAGMQAMVDVLVKFLSTKMSITEDEAKQLSADLITPLFKTTYVTAEEMTKAVSDVITEMQKHVEEESKKHEIITPTKEQVKEVTNLPLV